MHNCFYIITRYRHLYSKVETNISGDGMSELTNDSKIVYGLANERERRNKPNLSIKF